MPLHLGIRQAGLPSPSPTSTVCKYLQSWQAAAERPRTFERSSLVMCCTSAKMACTPLCVVARMASASWALFDHQVYFDCSSFLAPARLARAEPRAASEPWGGSRAPSSWRRRRLSGLILLPGQVCTGMARVSGQVDYFNLEGCGHR